MAARLLKLPEVRALIPLSKEAIYARLRRGTFPQPINLDGRAVAWDSEEINAWIENCKRGSRQHAEAA